MQEKTSKEGRLFFQLGTYLVVKLSKYYINDFEKKVDTSEENDTNIKYLHIY
jgi:hypothetical protein